MDNENTNVLEKQKTETLKILLDQIKSFDNKASIIVSILGLVMALSFTVIGAINGKAVKVKPYIFASFMLFLLSILTSLFFSIKVFMPRKRAKNIMVIEKSTTYYEDLKNMDEKGFEDLFNSNNELGISMEQINQNAIICSKKHKNLSISIFMLIPMAFFFVLTLVLIIWL